MKKISLAVILALIIFSFASCNIIDRIRGDEFPPDNGQDDTTPCEHTYADTWSSSSDGHWYKATCEHEDLKSDFSAHTDSDEDGACDVCTYSLGHTHTYTDTWSSDETHHWQNATCSHTAQKGSVEAHYDKNYDGACDICLAHVHVVDIFGRCTVCQEQIEDTDVADIDTILLTILASTGKVSGGTIASNFYSTTASSLDYIRSDKTVTYLLGSGSAYYKADTSSYNYGSTSTDTQERWYELTGDDSVFGLYRQTNDGVTGDFSLDGSASAGNIVGHYYSVSTLSSAYGAENLLADLYKLGLSDSASDYTYSYDNGKYTFSYNYLYANTEIASGDKYHADYYEVTVSFNVSLTGTLTHLSVECKCYTNSLENEIDNDFVYDPNTNTVTMKPDAHADIYTFNVTQTEGERTYVPEYTKSDFIPESFDVYSDEDRTVKVDGTLTVTAGELFRLYIGSYLPTGTSISYVADSFKANCDSSEMIAFTNAISESVLLKAKAPGTYTVSLTAGGVTASVTVNAVAEEAPPEDTQPENTVRVDITAAYSWTANPATFTAPESGNYTFTIPAGVYLGAVSDGGLSPWADFYIIDPETDRPKGGEITVALEVGESYKFFVCSAEKDIIVYISYTFTPKIVEDGTDTDNENNGENSGGTTPDTGTETTPDTGDSDGSQGGEETLNIEGVYTATSNYLTTVTVVVDATTIRFTFPNSNPTIIVYEYSDGAFRFWRNDEEITNPLGMSLTLTGRALTGMVYNASSYSLAPADPSVDVPVIEEPEYELGSELNPIILETLPESITITSDTETKTYYKFTATATGTITFTWPRADSWVDIFELDSYGYTTKNSSSTYATSTFSFDIEQGKTYRFSLGTWEIEGECTVTLTLEPSATA